MFNNSCGSSHIKVSVIVPVYKVEEYLYRCLDSLCAQTLDSVEFLLVDDGSPDNCGDICEQYSRKDSRFLVFHKSNGGLASARNYGIERARGEYIMFVDSDDWVRSDFCRTAYNSAIIHDSDLVMFCSAVVRSVYDTSVMRRTDLIEGHKSWQEAIDLVLSSVNVYAWNKIYKRSLFEGIRYPEGRLFEDQPVTWKLIYKAQNVYFTNEVLYYYFMRDSSIAHQETYKATKDKFEMRMQFYDGIREKGYSNEMLNGFIANAALSYAMRVKASPNDEISIRVNKLLKSYKRIPGNLLSAQKILMFMYIHDIPLFDLCCEIMGKRKHGQVAVARS